jgi:uncharacterized protein GlcG (DUF336 family)
VASIDIAMDRAFTSAGRGLTTRKLGEMAQPGQPLFGINTTNGGRIIIFAGGLPLTRDGEVVGAIGVSGGTVARTPKRKLSTDTTTGARARLEEARS